MVRCVHLKLINPKVKPRTEGCEECLRIGSQWVELRMCEICGHVGCCDSSPHRHATRHFLETQHPIIRSLEPGQHWHWCYFDQEYVTPKAA